MIAGQTARSAAYHQNASEAPHAKAEPEPHIVYRCYDADDHLLYIGCTSDIVSRLGTHRSAWGNPVSAALNLRMVRHTEAHYPDKASGRRAEREAIYAEAPLFNLHHQREPLAPAARRQKISDYLEDTRPEPDPAIAERFAAIAAKFAGIDPTG